jgi:hypothetical protein
MKPDIKVLLKEAQRPAPHFVPARAGWNGPEEKSAVITPNPTYEALRKERSPAELREQFLSLAVPDWRILLGIATLITMMRMMADGRHRRRPLADVLSFPSARPAVAGTAATEAA